ncbi:uncharacterized protein LOC128275129 [Anopheles cruzii]|uniref:uncharacterized protein LOC128275129 n=1 Tax=Anopheles cruzii TaxID=68878 RepID=UPI0022EC5B61|nr:uncharacterized protein LOC128275129 [Anopheles cruzii]
MVWLFLSIVLGCWKMSANGTIEEMMIAPIEVIEEWGCYETEIRMTCGNLESKIAILEAKFTPRCREQRTENCIYMDENSVTHPLAAQKVDKLILEETEAGRRFLATMRRNHRREMEAAAAVSSLAVPSALPRETVEATTTGEKHVTMMAARSFKDKRSSLRATLEHLIVRYLRRLTIDDDNDAYEEPGNHESGARYRRQSLPMVTRSIEPPLDEERVALSPETVEGAGFSNSMEITLLTNDTDTNLTQSWEVTATAVPADPTQNLPGSIRQPEVAESYKFSSPTISGTRNEVGGGADTSETRGHSVENHSANDGDGSVGEIVSALGDSSDDIEHNQSDVVSRGGEDDLNIGGGHGTGGIGRSSPLKLNGDASIQKKNGKHGRPRECGSVRKRVSQLDRFELERSMRNGSFREYNIRNALNYRCSGKNHCSFIFSQDHPFAVVWKEGTIRIKYICMDDFRVSKYCGEHLIVGNEIHWEPLDGENDSNDEGNDENTYNSEHNTSRIDSHSTDYLPPRTLPNAPASDFGANGASHQTSVSMTKTEKMSSGTHNGDDFNDESVAVVQNAVDWGAARRRREPRPEPLHAATVHSFHNLKIFKPIDELTNNGTDDTNLEMEAARNRNRQRQKVFSQDFRVLKILPSNVDVVEDIKQIGNEYYFKKDVEVVVDDSDNEILKSDTDFKRLEGRELNYSGTTGDGSGITETLDIVVLPAPTKDVEIYEKEILPEESSLRPDDISVIGIATPTRVTAAYTTIPMPRLFEKMHSTFTDASPTMPSPRVAGLETTIGHWDEERIDLPEVEESMPEVPPIQTEANQTGHTLEDRDNIPFSFNNRTFKNIQETVHQDVGGGQEPFHPIIDYDTGVDSTELGEDEEDEDAIENNEQLEKDTVTSSGSHSFVGLESLKFHKKYMSVQRTLLKHPLRQGFLMTPGYPKYYIGDSICRWTLYAGQNQRIKLTVLDIALRYDEECRDYLHVVDLNTNQTLFHSCTESTRPIEIVSLQERLEVAVRTTTKIIYPKRGVLLHYTALGCEVPFPTPAHMRLVRRTEKRASYVCDPLHVFPDTGESSRELICTVRHTWNRVLPACIEKRTTEGSGLVSHYEQKRKFGYVDSMSDKQADTVYDILIPSFVIAGLFIVNGIVFAVIMRYRNKRKQRLDLESKELAEL